MISAKVEKKMDPDAFLRSLITIGCWVNILAQLFDPSIQQIISYDESITFAKNDSSRVPRAYRWSNASIATTFVGVLTGKYS